MRLRSPLARAVSPSETRKRGAAARFAAPLSSPFARPQTLLFQTFELLQRDPILAAVVLASLCVSLAICISVHEFSHAYVASELGDNTARALGRVTLNPIRHLDPIGSVLIFLAGFGWGKPVPVDVRFLRGDPRLGMALVSVAGPASNVVAAVLFAIPVRLGLADALIPNISIFGQSLPFVVDFTLRMLVQFNLILAIFNLLPIAPLDGFKVALGLLPRDLAIPFSRTEPYGIGILLGLVALGFFVNPSPLALIIGRPVAFIGQLVLGGAVLG